MQKTTIFTIFFSILVVTLLAEFLTNNQLRSGWTSVIPPSSFVNNNTDNAAPVADNSTAVATPSPASLQNPSSISSSTKPVDLPPQTGAPKTGEVAQFLNSTTYMLERINDAQLQQMGFEQMHMERASAEGLLFQLLDTSDTVNLSRVRFHLTDGKNVYGVLSEYLLADEARAKVFYNTLKQKAALYSATVKMNETNSFGVASFYLNDDKRQGTAFLTILAGNRVFGLAYPKASHEYFKKLIGLLVN